MKTLKVLFAVLMIISTAASAQVCQAPDPIDEKAAIGIWHGHYTQDGQLRRLKIEVKKVNGQLVSYVDMPDRGIKNALFETGICESMEIHIKNSGRDDMALQFVGKPRGSKMTGSFSVGSDCRAGTAETFSIEKTNAAFTSVN